MTLHKFILSAVCILSFVLNAPAQQATAPKTSPAGSEQLPAEIKEKAVSFLRTTAKDAATLSLPENRLAFLIATADMLWEYDETAARQAFKVAESDVRQMITAQMQKAALTAASEGGDFAFLDAFTTGDGSAMDVQSIINLRESLVLAIGKHDGEAAYRFLIETRQPAPAADKDGKTKTNPFGNGTQLPTAGDYRESSLETRLAHAVAQNDPQKALEIGLKRLAVGLSEDLSSFAVRLYFKDKKRGAQLAQEIAKKAKSANLTTDDLALRVSISLLKNGANSIERGVKDKEIGKTPFLSESDLRELANLIGRAGIAMVVENSAPEDYEFGKIRDILPLLEKYSPSNATQIKAKMAENRSAQNRIAEVKVEAEGDDEYKKYLERHKKEEEALKDLQKSVESAKGEFSLQGARTALSLIKNRTARLTAMSQIAITFADNGKIEEAKELIVEARKTLAPQPKFWAHYVEHLVVARALASVEPKQSLEMIENLIYQIDDMLGGVTKIAEFIAGETAVKENELRLSGIPGMIGGGILSQMGRGGGARDFATGFEKDILKLAKADFDRTAALADKFSRPEIRLMARMILINSFLPPKDTENSAPDAIEADNDLLLAPPPPMPLPIPN
ncbi:MAG TPA: hypothetical protein VF571_14225 [Pyrinomonadaceae bacterium]|jgi:hypothetical protein